MEFSRASVGFVDVFATRHLPVVGTGADLAPRDFRRHHCRFVFLDPVCARDPRLQAARHPVWLDGLAVRRLHPRLRPHACILDLYVVGADLRPRRPGQGADRDRLDRHRGTAVAADPADPGDPDRGAAARGACRARGGRTPAPALGIPSRAFPRGGGQREHDPPGTEDGSRRPAHRRHRARLQQHPHRHHRHHRHPRRGGHPQPPAHRDHRIDPRRRRARRIADATPAGVCAQAAAAAERRRRQRADGRHHRAAATDHRRPCRYRFPPDARSAARAGRCQPARHRDHQSRAERARRDAEGRTAHDRDPHRRAQAVRRARP